MNLLKNSSFLLYKKIDTISIRIFIVSMKVSEVIMKRRLFVAIKVSDKIKKNVQILEKKCKNLPLKWLKKNDLHITVLSPWDEEDIDNAKRKLSKIKGSIKSFDIDFNHVTLGPYYDNPKLVWAKGKSSKELYELKEALEQIFHEHSDRRFKLHLSLARFAREDTREIMDKWENENISWSQQAQSLVLFESILENYQIKYKALKEVKL